MNNLQKFYNTTTKFSTIWVLIFFLASPSEAVARTNQSHAWVHDLRTLEHAFEQASHMSGVPHLVLMSMGYVESGIRIAKKLQSWPWAVHVQGRGYYFARKKDALAFIKQLIKQGINNIDLGCMQVNYRWHQKNFRTVEEMLDPQQNILYAALFLKALKKRHGSWVKAISAYHSNDQRRGRAYLMKVAAYINEAPLSSLPQKQQRDKQ